MFLAFAYDIYYPTGGSGDFRGAFDTFEEAKTAAQNNDGCAGDFAEVYDVAAKKWHDVTAD